MFEWCPPGAPSTSGHPARAESLRRRAAVRVDVRRGGAVFAVGYSTSPWTFPSRSEPGFGRMEVPGPVRRSCPGDGQARRRRGENLRGSDRTILDELELTNQDLYAGWLLIEQLRGVHVAHDYDEATELVDDWILAALESGMEPFQRTALTLDRYRGGIANGITFGLTTRALRA